MCRDLSEIATYARVDNAQYRMLKAATPGSYTFILEGTKELPRRVLHPKRKTIGLRVPDHALVLALLAELNEPLLSSTLILPNAEAPLCDPEEIRDQLDKLVDVIIDAGPCGGGMTTVINLVGWRRQNWCVPVAGRWNRSGWPSIRIRPFHGKIIQSLAIYALPVIFAITLHEAAHGYVARHFGDPTAWQLGRISLNPLRHIDLWGTIVIPALTAAFSCGLPVRLGQAGAGGFQPPAPPQAGHVVGGGGRPGANLAMVFGWALLLKLAILMSPNTYSLPLAEMALPVSRSTRCRCS